ncbi:MAG: LysE/ArgO family amino acid transporter [Rhodobacteraceae bacterium]|nr:LysE/ArgO family amino acid transporter [Paracoccaceae bacterium]
MTPALITGFLTSFALILAIGAQNAFVLRQGISGHHVFAVSLTCALSDAILITLGVIGFGSLMAIFPALPVIMRYAGAAFLLAYGALRFWEAWRGNSHLHTMKPQSSLRVTVLTALMLTWLNPHVYLDTLGLLGAVSTQFENISDKIAFTVGAVSASFIFFFSLGYGAKFMQPVMSSPKAWRVLDTGIGVLMWGLAAGLMLG